MAEYSAESHASRDTLRFVSNKELTDRDELQRQQNKPEIIALAAYLNTLWQSALTAKQDIQKRILEDYRARKGEYSPEKLAEIRKFGGSEIFMMLQNEKSRALESHIKEIYLPDDGRPWSLEPTPVSDLPLDEQHKIVKMVWDEASVLFAQSGEEPTPEALYSRISELNDQVKEKLQEEAKVGTERMTLVIEDQLAEGGWRKAIKDFIYDFSTTKAAILKGPIVRRRKRLKWSQGVDQRTRPEVVLEYVLEWERRSPLDIYPGSDATNIQDSYLFDRHQLSLSDLNSMKGLPGVDDAALRQAILNHGRNGLKSLEIGDQQRADLENRRFAYWSGYSSTIEAKEYWGPVPGYLLREWRWGMEVDETEVYHVNAWLIGNLVIKATINEHPLGCRPYSAASFESIPGSFWGQGPVELLDDYAGVCNAVARSLVNNIGMASGPQVVINDTDRVPSGEDITKFYPWRVWQFTPDRSSTSTHRPPIEFFQPGSLARDLLRVYDYFSQKADVVLGVPSYPMGELNNAAAKTASGMSMALGQASKGIESLLTNIDVDAIEPSIMRMYEFNMLYNPDESIKRDAQCVTRGSKALLLRNHLQLRKQEFLDRTNNPVDLQITGVDGRANILRDVAKTLNMPVDKIIPKDMSHLHQPNAVEAVNAQGGNALDAAGNPVAGQDAALFNQSSGV